MGHVQRLLYSVGPFALIGGFISFLGYVVFSNTKNANLQDDDVGISRKKRKVPNGESVHDTEDDRLIGMVNYGNTCFFNALLQALAACSVFRSHLRSQRQSAILWCQQHHLQNMEAPVMDHVLQLLSSLAPSLEATSSETLATTSISNDRAVKPASLLRILSRRLPQAQVHDQQDAHELLMILMLGLQAEVDLSRAVQISPALHHIRDAKLAHCGVSPASLYESHAEGDLPSTDKESQHCVETKASLQHLLSPLLSSTLLQCDIMQCLECGVRRATGLQQEATLILHLPSSRPPAYSPLPSPVSLQQLLVESLQSHVVTSSALDCTPCGRRTGQCRFTRLLRCPATLCVLLQRIGYLPHTWPPGNPVKLQDPVIFPLHLHLHRLIHRIHMSDTSYVSAGDGDASSPTEEEVHYPVYELRAVLVHYGYDVHSGHYAVYRRVSATSIAKWGFFSDEVVREVTPLEVLQAQPYMLFYERQ